MLDLDLFETSERISIVSCCLVYSHGKWSIPQKAVQLNVWLSHGCLPSRKRSAELVGIVQTGAVAWSFLALRPISQWWVWVLPIILLTSVFDHNPSFLYTIEDLSVEELIPQPSVEALAVSIFPRASWRDVSSLGSHYCDPILHGLGNEFGAIVWTNILSHAAHNEQIRKNINNWRGVQSSINSDSKIFSR